MGSLLGINSFIKRKSTLLNPVLAMSLDPKLKVNGVSTHH